MLNEHYEKWNRFGPIGFLVIGLGLSLTGYAVQSKSKGGAWFFPAALGMAILTAGLALFGEAVKARSLYETELNKLRK